MRLLRSFVAAARRFGGDRNRNRNRYLNLKDKHMQLRYDEDLIEAAVFLVARRASGLQALRFHREREKAYAILDPDERNAAFFAVHLAWFREWGVEQQLTDCLNEFPLLAQNLDLLALRKAQRKSDEGAELYVSTETGRRSGILALSPDWLGSQPARLSRFLRHELFHLSDMVDPAFGYVPELDLAGRSPARQRLARERYRLLWDICIDGRLTACGHAEPAFRDRHAAAFALAVPSWPKEQRETIFKSLWTDPFPSHAGLVSFLDDPSSDSRENLRSAPGALCPLCGFPTFTWAVPEELDSAVIARIAGEFPHWSMEQGLCARCHAVYKAAVAATAGPCALLNPAHAAL